MKSETPKIAVLIPHRGDRPQFLSNLKRMLNTQTLKPALTCEVDYLPKSNECDISQRYRKGYEFLSEFDFDLIAFMEVDDWYSPDYLAQMAAAWIYAGKPKMIGHTYTIYYHIFEKKYFTMNHKTRSSAMNTVIVPGLSVLWPQDNDPYTDLHLWKQIGGITFTPKEHICLGIKHGIGMVGGRNHNDRMERYTNEDNGFLKATLDKESYLFYTSL